MLVKIEFYENAGEKYGSIDMNTTIIKWVQMDDIEFFRPATKDGLGVVALKNNKTAYFISDISSKKLDKFLSGVAAKASLVEV